MEEKENKQMNGNDESSVEDTNTNEETVIGTIFQRIVSDEEFKKLLLSDPDKALSEYELSETQAVLIKSLSEEDLDKLTPGNLEEFFAADAAVYTPDEADLMDFESYDPEDFEELDNE